MRKTIVISLIVLSLIAIYQFQRPILTEESAVNKAKEYLQIINTNMKENIQTQKLPDYCVLRKDTFWNKMIGNRQWTVMIDGYGVDIQAYKGEFIQMVGPLDGVITELPN
ncbi:hypothetical protein [Paenibacillus qinlingensis]|uniref:Uncharacterized protein n=1 Tax=Paenibacillus qinlingensis TaxID=1837343 RepID=A0ABU1NRW6_9BACL|nr:hypothetical protein [Paenibacillus qinlingensis]MDR6550184.1 hypothetical protein [Paenibacillus qinlingensis]